MTGRLAAIAILFATALPACASLESARHYRDGSAALDRGEPAIAVVELERAAALTPDASHVQNHLGIAYEEAGRRDDAVRAYERAVALDCDNAAAQANLDRTRGAGAAAAGP